jgi:hypothetical protein
LQTLDFWNLSWYGDWGQVTKDTLYKKYSLNNNMRYLIIFLLIMLFNACARSPKNTADVLPVSILLTCADNPTCEFTGDRMPISIAVQNNLSTEIEVPLTFIQKTGPSIKLTDSLSGRTTSLRTNLADHGLRNNLTKIAPGRSASINWSISSFELRQFRNEFVDVTAQATYWMQIRKGDNSAPVDVTASSSVRIVSSATKAHTPSAARAPSAFGHTKVGATTLAALGAFEKPLLPLTGFTLITGGIVTRSTVYIFDFNAASLTMLRAAVAGRAVDLAQDQKQTIALPGAAQAEIVRLANAIWMSKNSYTNSPPESASFDVRLILVDSTAAKDIVSYGRPKFEAKQLFDLLLELTP